MKESGFQTVVLRPLGPLGTHLVMASGEETTISYEIQDPRLAGDLDLG